MLAEWIPAAGTLILGALGLYLAESYRRQAKVELAEARRKAYGELWQLTEVAAPTRLRYGGRGLLSELERVRLFADMTSWYYRNGNGMLLSRRTRGIYLVAKHNLDCRDWELEPTPKLMDWLPEGLSTAEKRGCLSIFQLSLLRTQMKSDLAVYGRVYQGKLPETQRQFLRYALGWTWRLRKPWRSSAWGQPPEEVCGPKEEPKEEENESDESLL